MLGNQLDLRAKKHGQQQRQHIDKAIQGKAQAGGGLAAALLRAGKH
jgi:hypothetical protein